MKHFAEFAPKGSRVLGNSKQENGASVFLFETPDGGITAIAVNEGEETTLEISGVGKCTLLAVTDADSNFNTLNSAEIEEEIKLKPRSITGIRFSGEKHGD